MSDKTKWNMERPEWWNRLQELWTNAVGNPGYAKEDWQELHALIDKMDGGAKTSYEYGVQTERKRCLDIAEKEFIYWREVDNNKPDVQKIAIGAVGASSNIFCRILGVKLSGDVT